MKHAIARKRLFMTKNLILMLVMAVVIVLAAFSWFSFSKTVKANNISVKSVSTEIDIAECVKTYDSNRDVLTDGPGEFGSSVVFNGPYVLSKDCTGDGETLIVPEFNVTKDFKSVKEFGKEVNLNLDPANAVSNVWSDNQKILHPDQDAPEYQYIQCEFYVRSRNRDLLLAADSQLLSRTEKNNGNIFTAITSNSNPKKSAYGDFNVDGLVGAMRVALIGEGCTSCNQHWTTSGNQNVVIREGANAPTTVREDPEKQVLWVPRPDVYLQVSGRDGGITDWNLLHSTRTGANHVAATYKNSYYKEKSSGTGVDLIDPDLDGKTIVSRSEDSNNIPCFGENFNISAFTYSDQLNPISVVVDSTDTGVTDNYYITKYTMKIWIEGTDAEARRAMDGGEFDLTLNFI